MRVVAFLFALIIIPSIVYSQSRAYEVHQRGMLHETIYNTGEIGRAMDGGSNGIPNGYPPSMEWPPNQHQILAGFEYSGQHNSFGGGVWVGATKDTTRYYSYCGALSTSQALSRTIEGVYSNPISVVRTENYPILADGSINPAYDPNEAEEIIVSKWNTVDSNFRITRTSRAWSSPGYNNFIIFEYEFANNTTDTLKDAFITFTNALSPSSFGYERAFNGWYEQDIRKRSFARLDTKRYLSYVHDWNGKPDTVKSLFDTWSAAGCRGGLNSPQAVGVMMLHYDYAHLVTKGNTKLTVTTAQDSVVWDANNKMKQPYLLRYENGNCDESKVQPWIDITARKTGPAVFADSAYYGSYWVGRVKPNYKNGWAQPVVHGYGYGPYILVPGETAKFSVAEVVGYGPGVAGDSIYSDLGGSTNTSETGGGMHPIPSWYKALSYSDVSSPIGSDYLQTHSLPYYVDSSAISIRDNADRCIQMYTGTPLLKHDGPVGDMTTQFEPKNTPEHGVYGSPSIQLPFPSPVYAMNRLDPYTFCLSWPKKFETFSAPNLRAPVHHYLIYRSPAILGPWAVVGSFQKGDIRFMRDSLYAYNDTLNTDFTDLYYYVVSVDSTGQKSGFTNLTHVNFNTTPMGVASEGLSKENYRISQNYPNPFNPSTIISYSVPKESKVELRVFNLLGQEVRTLVDEVKQKGNYTVEFNASSLPSGIYIYKFSGQGFSAAKKMVVLK
jgi:hypothetical protein